MQAPFRANKKLITLNSVFDSDSNKTNKLVSYKNLYTTKSIIILTGRQLFFSAGLYIGLYSGRN
jgi:hypothetical protein